MCIYPNHELMKHTQHLLQRRPGSSEELSALLKGTSPVDVLVRDRTGNPSTSSPKPYSVGHRWQFSECTSIYPIEHFHKRPTWWGWSPAHCFEVFWGGLVKVCGGRQWRPRRRSTGILWRWMTVGTDLGPCHLGSFPRGVMTWSFLMTTWSYCSTCQGISTYNIISQQNNFNNDINDNKTLTMNINWAWNIFPPTTTIILVK